MLLKIVFPVLAVVFTVGSGAIQLGDYEDVNPNDDGPRKALIFAVAEHNKRNNDMYLRQVAEVVKAQSQVIAGVKYVITVRMTKTTCRKDGANDVCAIHEDPEKAQSYLCTFTVWSQPWLRDIRLLEESC